MATAAVQPMETRLRRMTPISLAPDERTAVEALSRLLSIRGQQKRRVPQCQLIGPKGEQISLPESVFYVLQRVVEVLARGDAITVVPVGRQLTTQQAADLLNVSRQYLVRLLDEGRIAYTRTGKHRRLKIEDVLQFKEARDQERREALDELTRLSEDLGGYDELK